MTAAHKTLTGPDSGWAFSVSSGSIWRLAGSSLVAVGFLTFAQGASAQAAVSAAVVDEALISRIQASAQTLSFSGTYVHQRDATLQTSRISQLKDNKYALTKVQALEGRRLEIIRTPEEVRIYVPDQQAVKIDQTKWVRPGFPGIFVGNAADVLRSYQIIQGDSERIADVDTLQITLKPRDELRWPVRIWVDKKTSLLIKCQKLDFQGNVIEQVAFSEVRLAPKPTLGSLTPSFVGYKDWPIQNMSMQPVLPMPVLVYKPETLKGFQQVAVYQRQESAEEKRASTRRYVFSDGLATVSVFVQPKSVAGPLPSDQVNRRGALSMLSRQVQESWVTVMGEIPPETIKQFTQSIEWKATP